MRREFIGSLLAFALFGASAAAHAHGTGSHARKPNLDPVDRAFGRTGDPKKVTRTIRMTGTDDMRFAPSSITVKQGDTVRFLVTNKGRLMHEAVLGTLKELEEHAELMRKNPGMEHDEPYMAHVPPGQTGEMVWQFDKAGEFHFGCLVPGHFEAGMRGTIKVVPR